MAVTRRIIITDEALANLESTVDHISKSSPQNAALVADRIVQAIDSLSFMPDRFRRAGKSRTRGTPVHAMVVGPFIVYYRVEQHASAIHVINVRHGHQRQPRGFP